MTGEKKVRVELGGVPETLLWTLYNRAVESRRSNRILDDPLAVELLDRIDYPFKQRFGKPIWSQAQALRARRFDQAIHDFLAVHPDGTVVALGEGLETQFWRVDNGRVRWLTVDLPDVINLREKLLIKSSRRRAVACSALDERWMDAVNPSTLMLITAQGLFMYLEQTDVQHLISACARRFPGGMLVFDVVPHWLSRSTARGKARMNQGYTIPPMLWGMDANDLETIRGSSPNLAEVVELAPPRGRGLIYGCVLPLLHRIPLLHNKRLPVFPWVILLARFASQDGSNRGASCKGNCSNH